MLVRNKRLSQYKRYSKVPEITKAFIAFDAGKVKLFLLVFHKRHFIGARPWGKGFQPTPLECPVCVRMVMHPDDLLYDLASLPTKRKPCEPQDRLTKLDQGLSRLVRSVKQSATKSRKK